MSAWEKNKAGKRKRSAMRTGHAISNRVLRKDLQKLTEEEISKGYEATSHLDLYRK